MKYLANIAASATIICLATSWSAKAEDQFDLMIDDDSEIVQVFFVSTIKAFLWTNIALEKTGKERLYCQPDELDSCLELARDAARAKKARCQRAHEGPTT